MPSFPRSIGDRRPRYDEPRAFGVAVFCALKRTSRSVARPYKAARSNDSLSARGTFEKFIHRVRKLRLSGARARCNMTALVRRRPACTAETRWSCAMNGFESAAMVPRSRAFTLPSGEPALVRPIPPPDAATLQAYVRRLAPESRRNRFLGALNELSPRELARIAAMDRPGEIA